MEGGREGKEQRRERWRQAGMEGGREGKEQGRERGRQAGREGQKKDGGWEGGRKEGASL